MESDRKARRRAHAMARAELHAWAQDVSRDAEEFRRTTAAWPRERPDVVVLLDEVAERAQIVARACAKDSVAA